MYKPEEKKKSVETANVIESYPVASDSVKVEVNIIDEGKAFVRKYFLNFPEYGPGTTALLNNLRAAILSETAVRADKMMEAKFVEKTKQKFKQRAGELLEREVPGMQGETKSVLVAILLNEMLGLGKIEFLLSDGNLEEIVVNYSKGPAWVYHKKYGWLKTNVTLASEEEIENYASIIARRVGKQITILSPLLDAHLVTGDRANATLFPISSKGNTITIRMFRREPWTVTDFINTKTASKEIMALIWLAIEYELNIIVSGGTASGKTSFLNVCMPFLQANHRIISIEDTREIMLPEFLQWVPLTTREPNPEGKGGVCLYPGTWFVSGNGEINEISEYVEERLESRPTQEMESNVLAAEGKEDTVLAGDPIKLNYQPEKTSFVSRVTEREYVCKVECENGETMVLTENTKLPVVGKNGKIELLTPKEIKQGSYYLPAFTKLNVEGSVQEINILDLFSEGEFYAANTSPLLLDLIKEQKEKGLNLKQIAKKCGIKRQAFNWYKKTGFVRISVLKKLVEESKLMTLEQLEKEITQIKARGWAAKTVTVPKQVDEDIAYIAGFVLAEKSISPNGIHIVQKEELPEIERLVKKVFGIRVIHKRKEYNYYRILSQVFTKIMVETFGATRSKKIRVPKIIMRSPDKEIASFLAGYIDGDGTVGKNRVSLATGSKETAVEFKYLLTRIGIWSRIQKAERAWVVNVCTREDVARACKEIEFKLEKNKAKAELVKKAKYGFNTKRNRVPAMLLHSYLKSLMAPLSTEEKRKHFYHTTYNQTSVPKNYLEKTLMQAKLSQEEIQNLQLFLREDLEFVKITDVKIEKNNKNIPSYDITPEKSTYFIAGINNLTLVMDTMLDLLVNSLRMRPDRIIVGEIRRQKEAEVMFEAMHTGHSVYTTFHANTADETIRRFINPPVNVAATMLEAVHLNAVMFRNRRLGVRRMLQLAEYVPERRGKEEGVRANVLYRWRGADDSIVPHGDSVRLFDELSLHTGLSKSEIMGELQQKQKVLEWMVKFNVKNVTDVGRVIAQYYRDPDEIIAAAEKNQKPAAMGQG